MPTTPRSRKPGGVIHHVDFRQCVLEASITPVVLSRLADDVTSQPLVDVELASTNAARFPGRSARDRGAQASGWVYLLRCQARPLRIAWR
jgi:hypothetical protein